MLALLRNNQFIATVLEGSTFQHQGLATRIEGEGENAVEVQYEETQSTGPAQAGWEGTLGYRLTEIHYAPLPAGKEIVSFDYGVDGAGDAVVVPTYRDITTSPEQVNAERDRRTYAGFMFQGKLYDFDQAKSKPNITGAGPLALAAMMNGAQPGDYFWHGGVDEFAWIAHDNSLNVMDAQTVLQFGKAAAAWETAHIFYARALKALDPIPLNYTDDFYWPALV